MNPALLVLQLGVLTTMVPQPEQALREAVEAFEFGEHRSAADQLTGLLDPMTLEDRDDIVLARQYLGASLYLLGDRAKAERELSMLLALAPEHRMDPEIFSPALVQFFDEVRAKAGLPLKTAPKEDAPPPTTEPGPSTVGASSNKPPPPPPRLAPTTTIAPPEAPEAPSPALALVPFGVGQFSNGHPVRGGIFAASEVGLFTAAAVTFFMFEGLQRPDGTFSAEDVDRANRLQTTYLVTFWAGVAVVAAGIVEALISHPGDHAPVSTASTRTNGRDPRTAWAVATGF